MVPCGWEGNRRSGVALAVRHGLQWFIQGLRKGVEHSSFDITDLTFYLLFVLFEDNCRFLRGLVCILSSIQQFQNTEWSPEHWLELEKSWTVLIFWYCLVFPYDSLHENVVHPLCKRFYVKQCIEISIGSSLLHLIGGVKYRFGMKNLQFRPVSHCSLETVPNVNENCLACQFLVLFTRIALG